MKTYRMKFSRLWPWLAGLVAAVVPSGAAFAQGCAMCYNDASAAKASAIKALQHGTLILGVPVLTMFIAIFVAAYVNRDKFNEAGCEDGNLDRELDEWLGQPSASNPFSERHANEEQPCVRP
jgi:hypothetical protein